MIHGVDVSPYKIGQGRVASVAAGVDGRVCLEVVDHRWEPAAERYDVVVVNDVLYLLEPSEIDRVIRAACRSLAPDGRLVLKEVRPTPRWKHRIGMAEEVLAVRVLRITSGSHLNPDPLATVFSTLRSLGWCAEEVPLDRGYHHTHTAVVATRSRGALPGPR